MEALQGSTAARRTGHGHMIHNIVQAMHFTNQQAQNRARREGLQMKLAGYLQCIYHRSYETTVAPAAQLNTKRVSAPAS
jgi:hypothetical protein